MPRTRPSFVLVPTEERAPASPAERPPHLVPGQVLAVELHVEEPEAAAAWLKPFGFDVIARTPSFVTVSCRGQLLFLGRRPSSRPAVPSGTIGELRVIVPDAVALEGEIAGRCPIVVELHRAAYGLVEFVVASPFGIDIRVATPASWYEEARS